ncbi:MAG: oligosaccharide flippase family protein [Rhodobacteraceae bacterium]|nr:oligosaccharide flippase family protein [Paracoccaceae bacterium]
MLTYITSAFAVGVISRFSGQIIAFATVIVASRFLGLAEFGIFVLAWAAAVIANSFVFTGLYQALLRSPDPDRDGDTIFWLIFLVGAFGALIIGSVGLILGGMATQEGQAFCLLAPLPMLMAPVAWNEAQLVAAKRVRSASAYIILPESCALIVAYIGLKAGFGLYSLIAARYAMAIGSIVVTTVLVRKIPKFRMNRQTLLACRTTVPPLWGTTAMGMFSNYGTDLVLGAFLNPIAVGAYRGGSRISVTIFDLVLQPILLLSWSRFSRLEKENRTDLVKTSWMDNMALASAMIWPVMCSVSLLAPELVSVVFDETWLPAAPIVIWLSIARSAGFLSALLEPTMICLGKPRIQLRIRFIGFVLLMATLLAFGRFSAEAAGAAHLLTSVVVGFLSIAATITVLDLSRRDLVETFLPGLFLAGICAAAILATTHLRAEMGQAAGLFATVGLVVGVWLIVMVVGFQRKIIALPKP